MSQADTRAWWADVEHLRERIERRRELGDDADRELAETHLAEPRTRTSARPAGAVAAARPGPAHAGEGRSRRAATREPDLRPRRTVRIRGQAIPTITAPRLHVVEDDELLADAWADAAPDLPVATVQPSEPVAADTTAPVRRRPRRSPAEMLGPHPDRLAMWAVILGFTLVIAALLSAHGL